MRWVVLAAVAMLVILISVPEGMAQVVQFPTLYDDFHGKLLDPGRWNQVFARGYERSVELNTMNLKGVLRAYGFVGAPGFPDFNSGVIRLTMVDAAAAQTVGFQVTVSIDDVTVTGCGFTEPSRSHARLIANFFRDGPTPQNLNDFRGVVFARIQIGAFAGLPPNTLIANGFVFRCLDVNCDTDVTLGGVAFQPVAIGQDVTLGMELDAANNRIIFTKDAETRVVSPVAANQINTNLGPLHEKGIMVRHLLETCPIQAQGFITAAFENFRIKP